MAVSDVLYEEAWKLKEKNSVEKALVSTSTFNHFNFARYENTEEEIRDYTEMDHTYNQFSDF